MKDDDLQLLEHTNKIIDQIFFSDYAKKCQRNYEQVQADLQYMIESGQWERDSGKDS